MDRHPCRPHLRLELPAPGSSGSLCMRRLEGGVCEGLRGSVEQGHEPRSLRLSLSMAEKGRSTPALCHPHLVTIEPMFAGGSLLRALPCAALGATSAAAGQSRDTPPAWYKAEERRVGK